MTNVHPKLVILAVYQTKNGSWRGFCSPYDVTTEASTSEAAQTQLENQVRLYDEGLKKYNYPEHLTIKELSDPEDNRIFKIALKEVLEDYRSRLTNQYLEFQAQRKIEEITVEKDSLLINYSHYCFA